MVKQEKFATALALTDSGWAVRKWTLKTLLPSKFTLRTRGKAKPWQERGKYSFKVTGAKRDSPRASVESIAPWLQHHETGGTRQGGKYKGVPIAIGARPHPASVIKRPIRKVIKLKKAYWRNLGSAKALFVKKGKTSELLFRVSKQARIEKSLGFVKGAKPIARKAFEKSYPKRFKKQLTDSIRKHFKL